MPWQPALGTQPLAPFDHQVAGQSSMLRYDKTTVCKPLIAREHFVYKTLPQELAEFTPEYRGEIEVQLIEEDGYIQLYGLNVSEEASDGVYSCGSSCENHGHDPQEASPNVISQEASVKNRGTARVLRSGSYEVRPSTDEVFYAADSNPDHPHTHSLNPWSLKNHKRLLDKMLKSEHSQNKIRFILLKNVVADFRHPCILDLKIGSRLHGDDASSPKVASQSSKCSQTTSSTLGVRLCGMQVYQVNSGAYNSMDKFHGRTLNNESFRDMLHSFLHNGLRFRSELIQPVVSHLSQLIKCLENLHSFRFYASSLLIIYDGDVGCSAGVEDRKIPHDLFDEIQETSKDIHDIPGNREIPQDSIIAGNQGAKIQTFLSSRTADKNIMEHVSGHKDSLNFKSSSSEQVNSSKGLGHSLKKETQDNSLFSEEKNQSLTKQLQEVSVDVSSLSYPVSCQCLTSHKNKHPHNKRNVYDSLSRKMICKVPTKVLDQISSKEESIFETCTNHCGSKDFLKQPVSHSLSQKTDPAKYSVLNCGKHIVGSEQSGKFEDNVLCLNNHVNPQMESLSDVSSGVTKEHNGSIFDIHHPEIQSVLLVNQKHALETDFDLGIQMSSISSPNPTQKLPLVRNVDQTVHPSNLSLGNPTQTNLLDTQKDIPRTDLDQAASKSLKSQPNPQCLGTSEHSAVWNNTQGQSSGPEHKILSGDETLSPAQKFQDNYHAFPVFLQKPLSSQDISVVNVDTSSLTANVPPSALDSLSQGVDQQGHYPGASLSQSTNQQEYNPLTSLSHGADQQGHYPLTLSHKAEPKDRFPLTFLPGNVPQDISSQPDKITFQDHMLPNPSSLYSNNVKVDVKMIDFAHTTHKGFTSDKVKHMGPDTDYILGLRNLVKLFQDLQRRE